MVVEAAIQEDVSVIGISILSGAHMTFFPEILRLLRERGAEKIAVIGGGVIPVEDIVVLKEMGVRELFPAGSSLKDIVEFVREIGAKKE
jgi:methylmalonyl-CoA mutase C-terminal domain/subunit